MPDMPEEEEEERGLLAGLVRLSHSLSPPRSSLPEVPTAPAALGRAASLQAKAIRTQVFSRQFNPVLSVKAARQAAWMIAEEIPGMESFLAELSATRREMSRLKGVEASAAAAAAEAVRLKTESDALKMASDALPRASEEASAQASATALGVELYEQMEANIAQIQRDKARGTTVAVSLSRVCVVESPSVA